MKPHFQMFAAYNGWANRRLYEAASDLDEEEWRRDVGAFFTSMAGTLNHVLAADRIWMRRFTGQGAMPATLDTILHPDLAALGEARSAEDRRIADWIDGLAAGDFEGSFSYVTITDRRTVTQRLAPALAHFFNHQTHHRGQAHGILSQLGREPPSLDLIRFQRENAASPG